MFPSVNIKIIVAMWILAKALPFPCSFIVVHLHPKQHVVRVTLFIQSRFILK